MTKEKLKSLCTKFLHYVIVGGISSVVDFGLYYVVTTFILRNTIDTTALIAGATVGFFGGLGVNYILSLFYVWRIDKGETQGKTPKDVIVFIGVGLLGLLLSNIIVGILGVYEVDYRLSKLVAMTVTLVWNFVGRNVLIFGKSNKKG